MVLVYHSHKEENRHCQDQSHNYQSDWYVVCPTCPGLIRLSLCIRKKIKNHLLHPQGLLRHYEGKNADLCTGGAESDKCCDDEGGQEKEGNEANGW